MTTLPNMGLVLPTRGAPGAGQWGDTDDANSARVDAHDHSPGKGVLITPAAISINADLPLNSSWGITAANRISFASVASPSTNKSLFVSDGTGGLTASELYWRSNTGTAVRLTAGSALNVAAFAGGIGGDYTAVGAAVAFDDAGDRYTFKQQSNVWARMASGDVRLFETGTSESIFVGLAAPGALASSYTITMPLTAPTAGTRPVQMSTAGVLTAGDSDNVQIGGTLGATGAATLSSTLTVNGISTLNGTVGTNALNAGGLITAIAGLTASANQHVTVSGTGRFKHGTMTLLIPGSDFEVISNSFAWAKSGLSGISTSGAASGAAVGIQLPIGARILTIRVYGFDSAVGPTKIQANFNRVDSTGGNATIASSAVSAGSGANQTLTIGSLTTTVATLNFYSIEVNCTTGTASWTVRGSEVDYDFP